VLETLEPMLAEGEEESKTLSKNADAAKSEEKARRRRRDAARVHDALKRAVGACLHAALAVPSSLANAASEPERRAARKNKNTASTASGSVGPRSSAEKGAGSVAGWKIGKAPGTLRVDVAGAETEIAIGDAVLSDTSEDPKAVAAKVAAAAALLGDCVVPYAAVPEAAGAFI
jgi:hypothetical protein